MDTKKSGKPVLKDLAARTTKDVKGGATATRLDPYRNFKFRVVG